MRVVCSMVVVCMMAGAAQAQPRCLNGKLPAPTSLWVSSKSSAGGEVVLSWQPVFMAAGYMVQQCEGQNCTQMVFTSPWSKKISIVGDDSRFYNLSVTEPNATSFRVTGCAPQVRYSYRICAFDNNNVHGYWSPIVNTQL